MDELITKKDSLMHGNRIVETVEIAINKSKVIVCETRQRQTTVSRTTNYSEHVETKRTRY